MNEGSRLPGARVHAVWRRVAVQLTLATVAGVIAFLAGLLLVSWALGSSAVWQRPSVAPLLLVIAVATSVAAWVWWMGRRVARWNRRTAAAAIERAVDLPRGSVQGAVEPGLERPGTSESLVELHRLRLAGRLEGLRLADLGGGDGRRARSSLVAATALAIIALMLTAAVWTQTRPSATTAWAAVLHPVHHLRAAPLPRVVLSAITDRIRRGDDLAVEIRAPERDSVQLLWRPDGELATGRWYDVVDGRTSAAIPRVEAETRFWATTRDGATSDTLHVLPVDPLLLIDVGVDFRFPRHTGLEREIFSTPLPVMSVPEGTRAIVTGVATRSLGRVALRSGHGAKIPFDIPEERRFRSSFIVRPGLWGWDIVGSEGDALEGEPDSIHFLTVADSAPQVRIVFPGVDTVLDPSMTQPLLIDVRDDYGLSQVELVSWRVSAWGETWPTQIEALPLADIGSRANLAALLDAQGRGFLPGDTLRYFVQAYDNAPEPQLGRSREYVLSLPTLDQVREQAIADARELVEAAERLAQSAREHQESTQALDRSGETQPPPGSQGEAGSAGEEMEFRETEAARQALEEASDLLEQAAAIQDALRELQEGLERSGLNDQSVLDRLREIEALYERILTPELKEKIEALREALVELDAERIQQAIGELAEGSIDFREQVERSVELLRRAALEQEFSTLETQADELAEAQEQLAEAAVESEADAAADRIERRAEDLSENSDALSERLDEFAEELNEFGEDEAGDRASQAERAAHEAARSDELVAASVQRERQQAARSARNAADQMQQAASALREGRQEMQESWRQEVVEALGRAQTEALELARRQQGLNERLNSGSAEQQSELRSEEVALKRGLDQIEQQLSDAAESSLLVDPTLMQTAGQVEAALEQLLEQLSDGTRQRRISPRLGSQVSEGLNELAFQLMQAGDEAASAQSGTGVQEALEQLAQMAEQQGDVNAQAGGITPGAMSDVISQALQQLAGRQRGIAQELESLAQSMGPRGQVLGQLDALADEAEDIASELDRGRLDEQILERQGELFERLLDAGRTLERDEFERDRRAERPTSVEVIRPGVIPTDQLGGPQFPHPGSEALSRYPPAFRRLILEYFDRLNEPGSVDDS